MSQELPSNHKRYTVPGLERGLKLLELLSHSKREVSLPEAAQALGISRSSSFRLIYTLEYLGYLRRGSDERKYSLGSQVLRMAASLLAGLDIIDIAQRPLAELQQQTGGSVHLAVRDGTEIIYVISLAARQRITTNIHVGTRLPAHATSMGRILLGALQSREIRQLYKGVRLKAYSDHTVTSVAKLVEAVAEAHDEGHVISRGHYEPEIWSIAAPVLDLSGNIVAAISVTYPSSSVDRATFGEHLEHLRRTAREISALLGYRDEGNDTVGERPNNLRVSGIPR